MAARVIAPDAPADAAAAAAAGELALGADQLMWLAETGVKTTQSWPGCVARRSNAKTATYASSLSRIGGWPSRPCGVCRVKIRTRLYVPPNAITF